MALTTRSIYKSGRTKSLPPIVIGSASGSGIIKTLYVNFESGGELTVNIDGETIIPGVTITDIFHNAEKDDTDNIVGIDNITINGRYMLWKCNFPFTSSFDIRVNSDFDDCYRSYDIQCFYLLDV